MYNKLYIYESKVYYTLVFKLNDTGTNIMNVKKLRMAFLTSILCFSVVVQANEVRLTVNKPINITYRLAYQDTGNKPVLGELQSVQVDKSISIPINLNNHAVVGIVPVSADGHVLPNTANQFNQPNQCSMTTNAQKTSGELAFIIETKKATCKTKGGVFG